MKPDSNRRPLYSEPKTSEQRQADRDNSDALRRERAVGLRNKSVKNIVVSVSLIAALLLLQAWLASFVSPVAMGLLVFPFGLMMIILVVWLIRSIRQALSGRSSA